MNQEKWEEKIEAILNKLATAFDAQPDDEVGAQFSTTITLTNAKWAILSTGLVIMKDTCNRLEILNQVLSKGSDE